MDGSHLYIILKYLNLGRAGSDFKGLFLTFIKKYIHKLLVILNSKARNTEWGLGGITMNSCLWRLCFPKHPKEGREC